MSDNSRIACVDDDESVCNAIVGFLKSHGLPADAFPTAESFLQSSGIQERFCLITDVRLSGMSGLQLHTRLLQAGLDIPTIFITAFADDMTRSRAMAAGAVGFLSKPVPQQALLDCIRKARARSGETH